MLFNSLQFLLFLPIVAVLYFAIPKKVRYIWLLLASYFFYMCWNAKYALLMLFSTAVTYLGGLGIDYFGKRQWDEKKIQIAKKLCVALSFILNLAVLVFFKYSNFLLDNVQKVFLAVNISLNVPTFDIILPVGISFYTFQALSYTMDVYRNEIYAEKNFLRYALFVSFFPQLVAGPIERSKNLLKQLAVPSKFSYKNFLEGLLLMLWGYFMKVVLADRIAIFVDTVYGDFGNFGGWYLIVATVLFAFQIYCDFGGYSVIAMGAAKILGIDLMENFNAPYLARSTSEFWRRWHISLSTWFRDYLYIPLGGNRKGKLRKYFNLQTVFLVSGLWHGANWSYVIWGGLNGLWQIIGEVFKPVRMKLTSTLRLNRESFSHKLLQMLITFVLIDFTWIFFRADRFMDALQIIVSMVQNWNPWVLFDNSIYNCGLDQKDFSVMLISLGILLSADIAKYKGVCIRKKIMEQNSWFQYVVVAVVFAAILVFGIYGSAYDAASFIYFQF